jgi:hypothetical protein
MKRTTLIMVTIAVTAALACLYFGLAKGTGLKTDQDFISFALEAEKRLVTVHFVANPEQLKKLKLKPLTITSKKDVANILAPYWDKKIIDYLWESGSSAMTSLPFGFYTEMDIGLLEASQIRVLKKGPTKVIVTGKVNFEGETYDREMILVRTSSGWKAVQ